MKDPLKALFGKPDYSRIVRDTTATISITAAEMAAVLEAHDRIDTLDGTRPRAAVELLGKLSFNELAQWAAKPSAGATSWAVGGDARYGR